VLSWRCLALFIAVRTVMAGIVLSWQGTQERRVWGTTDRGGSQAGGSQHLCDEEVGTAQSCLCYGKVGGGGESFGRLLKVGASPPTRTPRFLLFVYHPERKQHFSTIFSLLQQHPVESAAQLYSLAIYIYRLLYTA
jgi:hypothetical protein